MDRFFIKGKSNADKNVQPPKRKSQAEKDKEYDKKRKRLFQTNWLTDFPWLRVESEESDIAFCSICRQYPQIADKTSGLYIGKGITRRDTLTSHQLSSKHVSCCLKHDSVNKKKTGPLEKSFSKVEKSEVERYEKLFNTAYAVAKHNKPYTDFSFLCQLQIKNGIDLGKDHINRDACTDFIKSISLSLLEGTKCQLENVGYFSLMSDSSTDSAVIEQEGILIRFVDPKSCEPVTSIASIEKLENARAEGVFEAINRGLQKCGLGFDNIGQADSKLKLVCVNLDGAAVNMGAKNGVAKKVNDSVSNKVLVTHCVAHRLELGVLDAVKEMPYLKKFEDTIKRICKFYSFSPKRREELKHLASVLDEAILMHTEIKAVRWVASKFRALVAVAKDLHVTFTHLEQVVSNSNRADELGQAKSILNDLKQVKFVKYIHLMMDVLEAVTAASKLFQNKDLLIFEVKEAVDALYTKLHSMTVEPGDHLSEFYTLFDKSTNLFDGKLHLTGSLSDFQSDNDVHTLLEKITQYIVRRFSDLDCSPLSNYRVFDFRIWPHTLADLSVYGKAEIKSLCEHHKDILGDIQASCIINEWQTLKVQVSLQRQYHPLDVYSSILKRNEDTLKNVNELIKIFLTISPSTASCERLFSSMNLVKSPLRTRLSQENLQHQMRVIANGKSFQDFNPRPAVEYWLKTGNRHITHKAPVRSVAKVPLPIPGSSTQSHVDDSIQPMLQELVKSLGGEEAARKRLKEYSSDEHASCTVM